MDLSSSRSVKVIDLWYLEVGGYLVVSNGLIFPFDSYQGSASAGYIHFAYFGCHEFCSFLDFRHAKASVIKERRWLRKTMLGKADHVELVAKKEQNDLRFWDGRPRPISPHNLFDQGYCGRDKPRQPRAETV